MLIYNGQLDIIVAAPLTEHSLMVMNWKGSQEYRKAKRKIWKIFKSDAEVAGYVRQVGDFHQVGEWGATHFSAKTGCVTAAFFLKTPYHAYFQSYIYILIYLEVIFIELI